MAFSPIAQVASQFEDFPGYFLKGYDQGTTTPQAMATDSTGGTLLAKAEISSGGAVQIGFIKTAGDVIFIPFFTDAYDLFLFPDATTADANDFTDAIQVADNFFLDRFVNDLITDADSANVSLIKEHDSVAAMVADISLIIGKAVQTLGSVSSGDGGANLYEVVAAATGTDDGGSFIDLPNTTPALQAKALFPGNVVIDKQYGIFGTDTSADTAAANAALVFASASNLNIIFSSDFTVSSDLVIPGDIELQINGEITLTSAVSSGLGTIKTARGAAVSLAGNVAAGDTVLSVSTGTMTGLAVGDYLLLSSTEVFDPRTSSLFGEGCIVSAFSGSTITVDRPVVFAYTTANSAKAEAFKPYRINLYGIGKIIGDGVTDQIGFDLRNCIDSSIEGLSTQACFTIGTRFVDSVDCTARNITGTDSQKSTLGYITSTFGASRNVRWYNIIADTCRHAFTTNNFASPLAGVPIDIYVYDGLCKNTISTGDAWDTHAAAWNINFIRCKSLSSSANGFNFEAASGGIFDCQEQDSTNEAYRIHNETFQGGVFKFTGNSGNGCTENGVQMGSSIEGTAVPFSKVLIDQSEYSDAGQNGVLLQTGLGDAVLVGVVNSTGAGSSEVVYDTENISFTSGYDNTETDATIASGAVVFKSPTMVIIPEGGTPGTDDLETISGGTSGQRLTIQSSSNSNTITVKDITGNLSLTADFVMDTSNDRLFLEKGSSGDWYEISRSNNS